VAWLDLIEKDLVGSPHDIPDILVAHNSRAVTFNIQALGRLYEDEDSIFDEMHKKFQKLEDDIGEYQKWKDLAEEGRAAGVSPDILKRLETNRDNGRAALEKTLVSTRFVATDPAGTAKLYIPELRRKLQAYAWKDATADREDMRSRLIAELEVIRNAKYDFSHLEGNDGIHEFRRKMRWFSMEARALNGLVTLKPVSAPCPVPSYASIVNQPIAHSKYAVLPGAATEPNPFTLTPCLYVKVAKLIDDVNQVKAKEELEDSLSEHPSNDSNPADQAKVEAMLRETVDNNLFGLLEEELAAAR
jgi:hypothetical protein